MKNATANTNTEAATSTQENTMELTRKYPLIHPTWTYTGSIPKTLASFCDDNVNIIEEINNEGPNDYAETRNDYWVYLRHGFICGWMDAHLIHESTIKDVKSYWKSVKPCNCDQCRKGIEADDAAIDDFLAETEGLSTVTLYTKKGMPENPERHEMTLTPGRKHLLVQTGIISVLPRVSVTGPMRYKINRPAEDAQDDPERTNDSNPTQTSDESTEASEGASETQENAMTTINPTDAIVQLAGLSRMLTFNLVLAIRDHLDNHELIESEIAIVMTRDTTTGMRIRTFNRTYLDQVPWTTGRPVGAAASKMFSDYRFKVLNGAWPGNNLDFLQGATVWAKIHGDMHELWSAKKGLTPWLQSETPRPKLKGLSGDASAALTQMAFAVPQEVGKNKTNILGGRKLYLSPSTRKALLNRGLVLHVGHDELINVSPIFHADPTGTDDDAQGDTQDSAVDQSSKDSSQEDGTTQEDLDTLEEIERNNAVLDQANDKVHTVITRTEDGYRVRLFINDEYQAGADYFADDYAEAQDTAVEMEKNAKVSDKDTPEAQAEQADYDEEQGGQETAEGTIELPADFRSILQSDAARLFVSKLPASEGLVDVEDITWRAQVKIGDMYSCTDYGTWSEVYDQVNMTKDATPVLLWAQHRGICTQVWESQGETAEGAQDAAEDTTELTTEQTIASAINDLIDAQLSPMGIKPAYTIQVSDNEEQTGIKVSLVQGWTDTAELYIWKGRHGGKPEYRLSYGSGGHAGGMSLRDNVLFKAAVMAGLALYIPATETE